MWDLRDRYITVRPAFGELATFIEQRLALSLQRAGLMCSVKSRTKDVASVLRKQLLRNYSDPMVDMTDLAGIRVVIPYSQWVLSVETAIRETCEILKVD